MKYEEVPNIEEINKHGSNIYGDIVSLPLSTRIGAFCDIGGANFGENCKIETMVSIPPGWKIGNNVFIGPGARFANDRHPNLKEEFNPEEGIIEDDVVIGMGALILPCKIGKGAIIGAGSVVLHDVLEGATVVGNPARQIYKGKDYEQHI